MNLELTRIFVKVVQQGSFSKAAGLLGVPKSTVSKSLRRLEAGFGTRLMVRTTRSLTLTDAGRTLFGECVGPIQKLEQAEQSILGRDQQLAGRVRITAPEDLGAHVIAPALGRVSIENPDLSYELFYTDDLVDLVKDGFDLAVRIGKLNISGFTARRLGEVVLIPVAGPIYLKKTDAKIRHPKDLESHICLGFRGARARVHWNLRSARGSAQLSIKPKMISNQMTSLVHLARTGAGIALVPKYLAKEYLEDGTLTQVLPDWTSPGLPVALLSPLPFSSSTRLKFTADHLTKEIQSALSE